MKGCVKMCNYWNHEITLVKGCAFIKRLIMANIPSIKITLVRRCTSLKKQDYCKQAWKSHQRRVAHLKNTQWRNLEAFDAFIVAVFVQFLYCLSMVLRRFWQAFDLFSVFLCGLMDLNWTVANALLYGLHLMAYINQSIYMGYINRLSSY